MLITRLLAHTHFTGARMLEWFAWTHSNAMTNSGVWWSQSVTRACACLCGRNLNIKHVNKQPLEWMLLCLARTCISLLWSMLEQLDALWCSCCTIIPNTYWEIARICSMYIHFLFNVRDMYQMEIRYIDNFPFVTRQPVRFDGRKLTKVQKRWIRQESPQGLLRVSHAEKAREINFNSNIFIRSVSCFLTLV